MLRNAVAIALGIVLAGAVLVGAGILIYGVAARGDDSSPVPIPPSARTERDGTARDAEIAARQHRKTAAERVDAVLRKEEPNRYLGTVRKVRGTGGRRFLQITVRNGIGGTDAETICVEAGSELVVDGKAATVQRLDLVDRFGDVMYRCPSFVLRDS